MRPDNNSVPTAEQGAAVTDDGTLEHARLASDDRKHLQPSVLVRHVSVPVF